MKEFNWTYNFMEKIFFAWYNSQLRSFELKGAFMYDNALFLCI